MQMHYGKLLTTVFNYQQITIATVHVYYTAIIMYHFQIKKKWWPDFLFSYIISEFHYYTIKWDDNISFTLTIFIKCSMAPLTDTLANINQYMQKKYFSFISSCLMDIFVFIPLQSQNLVETCINLSYSLVFASLSRDIHVSMIK